MCSLNPPANTRTCGTWDDSVDRDKVTCPLNDGHQRAGRRTTELSIDLPVRALDVDFVWTWLSSDCLVNDRVAAAFSSNNITGFELRPAQVAAGGVRYDKAFKELVITGWGGIAPQSSGVQLAESCPGCGLLIYSGVREWQKLFDPQQWDGSDPFLVWPLPRFICATERIASLIWENRFNGVSITPLAQMTGAKDIITPGRVSYWLSENRVNELGIDSAIR
jgi:hypothetical protein